MNQLLDHLEPEGPELEDELESEEDSEQDVEDIQHLCIQLDR